MGLAAVGVAAAAIVTTAVIGLGKALFDAGVSAEQSQLKLQFFLGTTKEGAAEVFNELRELARTLPVTTQEVIDSFTTIRSAGFEPTDEALKGMAAAASIFGRNMADISRTVLTLESEPLKNLGIILDQTGKTAKITFNNMTTEVEKTQSAMREGLLKLFEDEFAPAIELSANTFNTAFATFRSVIDDFLTGAASPLSETLTGIVQDTTAWIDANKEVISDVLVTFVKGLTLAIEGLADAVGIVIDVISTFVGGIRDAISAISDWAGEISSFISNEFENLNNKLKEGAANLAAFLGNKQLADEYRKSITDTSKTTQLLTTAQAALGETLDINKARFMLVAKETEETQKQTAKHGETAKKTKSELEKLTEALDKQVETLKEQIATFGMTEEQLIEYSRLQAISKGVSEGLANEVANLSKELLEMGKAAEQGAQEMAEALQRAGEFFFDPRRFDISFGIMEAIWNREEVEETKDEIDSFTQFVGSAFANLGQDIGGTIVEAGNVWEATLNSMKRIAADLIGFLISNPIRLLFEGATGGGGGGGLIGGLLGGLGGIGESFRSLGSLFLGEFAGLTGLIGTLGAALPAIGAIAAIGIPVVAGLMQLFQKEPRARINIGEFNKGLEDRVAVVRDFVELVDDPNGPLGKDLIEIGLTKVSGKAKEIRELLFDKANAVVDVIQDLIFQLPEEFASALNEELLSTELRDVDLGKPRLLGINIGAKEAAKRLKEYLESGEFETEFLASLSGFFEEFLATLGVLPEKAVEFVRENLFDPIAEGKLRGEEAAALGDEFLAAMQSYVDAFNLIHAGVQDSFDIAISQIKALANELGIVSETGIPSLEQLKDRLMELFETAELTADTAQKFTALREAIVQLTVALAQSVTQILGIIQQLNTDIVALGGEATDLTESYRQSIARIKELLQNENLSTEERLALLQQLNQLTDAYADSLREVQTTIVEIDQAAIEAKEAAISAIDTQIAANNARIDSLNAEIDRLRNMEGVARELEGLVKSIQNDIDRLRFSSDVFGTASQRIRQAQDEVNALFRELATAPEREKAEIGRRIQELLNTISDLGEEAFDPLSLEGRAAQREVLRQLEMLQEMVGPIRSSEAIQESIEQTQQTIRGLQEDNNRLNQRRNELQRELNELQAQANQTITEISELTEEEAAEILELKEFLRDEYLKAFETRQSQLAELAESQIDELKKHTILLADIVEALDKPQPRANAQGGLHGRLSEDTLIQAHAGEYVDIGSKPSGVSLSMPLIVNGDIHSKDTLRLIEGMLRDAERKIERKVSDKIVLDRNFRIRSGFG